ncbi:MAG: hypothetical protein F4Y14_02520, partial [Acidobacteria bacterium]|nr:hypothetical protein [Acidobacteriota bacterium]
LEAGGSTLSSPYSVSLPAGQSSTSFTIRVTDDSTAEPVDESVTISATVALTNRSLGSRGITIPPSDVPNVPDVTIEAGQSSVTEGGTASFTLRRSGSTTAALTASVVMGTTNARISGASPSSLTFAAGSDTVTHTLEIHDDTVVRPEGWKLQVWVYGSSANPPKYLTTAQNSVTITVTENDVASFTVTPSAQELTEGQTLTVTVDTGGVTFPANQDLELRLGGSATAGSDYTLPGGCTGSICVSTLQRGAQTARASFRTRYDGVEEGTETIRLDAYHDGAFIGLVSVDLLDGAAPPVVSGPSGGGGGGGFGPPPPPQPSQEDLKWNVTGDLDELADGHGAPTGVWGSPGLLWILDNASSGLDRLYAYATETGAPVSGLGFELDPLNRSAKGLWSDGVTAWISDSARDRLFAYRLETGERVEARELTLHEDNTEPRGIWSDGRLVYVVNRAEARSELFSYLLESGELTGRYSLDRIINREPHGVWSDGEFIWVADSRSNRVQAYRIDGDELEKVESQTVGFRTLIAASNSDPRGIWSNGDLLFVVDANDGKVYSYNLPDASQAWLASLTIEGVEFGPFSPLRPDYEGTVEADLAQVTVEAVATQSDAVIAVTPVDADGDPANGHQILLEDGSDIEIVVTSEDTSRMRTYTIAVRYPNRAPLSKEIPPLTLVLGSDPLQITLSDYFNDPDGGPLVHTVSEPADEGVVGLSEENGVLTLTPLRVGATSFDLSASDGEWHTEPRTVLVSIEPAADSRRAADDRPAATDEQAEVSTPEVRIAARQVDGERVEFALQVRAQGESWQRQILPQRRFLPADAATGAWRVSSAIEVAAEDSARTVRIGARHLDTGQVEFALLVRLDDGGWSARLLPMARFLPPTAEVGRWRYSTPLLPVAP